jgi:hypothetical protein
MPTKYEQVIQAIKSELMCPGGELEREAYRWIQEMGRTHSAASIKIIDSGYDVSSFGQRTNSSINTAAFDTIQNFLDYPTGESIPTFCSGAGMAAETWEDRFREFVRDYTTRWLSEHGFDPMIHDQEGDVDNEFIDALDLSDASEYAFVDHMAQKPYPRLMLIRC